MAGACSYMPVESGDLVKKCCIAGLGLIGCSLGLALGKHGLALERWGYDIAPQARKEAEARGAVDKTAPLAQALDGAELIILAAPVGLIPGLLAEAAPFLAEGALVTDVGSSKRAIVEAAHKVLPPGTAFIGGHPMAGSEQPGIGRAHPDLFQEAAYFLTLESLVPEDGLELMKKIIHRIGAYPVTITPAEHDRLMAPLSHLPQLIATALVNTLAGYSRADSTIPSLAGRGFKDSTRIAAGAPYLWQDILISNRDNLLDCLDLFMQEIERLRGYLKQGDKEGLSSSLVKAASLRRTL